MKTKVFLFLFAFLPASVTLAQLSPVFLYTFPESFDASSTAIVDVSGAGNDATMDQMSGFFADTRPLGVETGGSISGSAGGHGQTNAIDQLDNSLLEASGGFVMSAWFMWPGNFSDVRKIVDYAGTEYLRTFGGEIQFGLSDGGTVLGATITPNQWYYVEGVFNTTGNTVDGNLDILGDAELWLDGELVASAPNVLKTSFGDSLDRVIGINRWAGGGADWNQGFVYEVGVSLGTPIPEPGTYAAIFGALVLLLAIRRRRS